MPTVKASSTFGNYKWFGHADVSQEQLQVLADLGYLWVMQRSPSSRAEKLMGNYEKRPENYKRSMIPHTPEGERQLATELAKPVEIEKDIAITPVIDKVEFYEIGKGTEPAYKDEKTFIARHVKAGDLLDWIHDEVGYEGEIDREPENDTKVLAAVKAYKQRRLTEL